jgi:hypothetical protein
VTQQQQQPGTLLDERTDLRLDEGDHERFSHYVDKAKLTEAMVLGAVAQPRPLPGLPRVQGDLGVALARRRRHLSRPAPPDRPLGDDATIPEPVEGS